MAGQKTPFFSVLPPARPRSPLFVLLKGQLDLGKMRPDLPFDLYILTLVEGWMLEPFLLRLSWFSIFFGSHNKFAEALALSTETFVASIKRRGTLSPWFLQNAQCRIRGGIVISPSPLMTGPSWFSWLSWFSGARIGTSTNNASSFLFAISGFKFSTQFSLLLQMNKNNLADCVTAKKAVFVSKNNCCMPKDAEILTVDLFQGYSNYDKRISSSY